MTPVAAVLGCVLGFAIAWVLTRPRKPPRPVHTDECVCGLEVSGDDLHLVVSQGRSSEANAGDGGTFMAAAFCATHCPGGCLKGCPDVA